MVKNWKEELNRLATEFWFHSVDEAAVTPWVESAYEAGETGVELAEMWGCPNGERTRTHFQLLAKEINGFEPWSAAALPFAVAALERALCRYLTREIDPSALCRVVDDLDTAFLDTPSPPDLYGWRGNLWNCCDWCDATWTFENAPYLQKEATVVLARLKSLNADPLN